MTNIVDKLSLVQDNHSHMFIRITQTELNKVHMNNYEIAHEPSITGKPVKTNYDLKKFF